MNKQHAGLTYRGNRYTSEDQCHSEQTNLVFHDDSEDSTTLSNQFKEQKGEDENNSNPQEFLQDHLIQHHDCEDDGDIEIPRRSSRKSKNKRKCTTSLLIFICGIVVLICAIGGLCFWAFGSSKISIHDVNSMQHGSCCYLKSHYGQNQTINSIMNYATEQFQCKNHLYLHQCENSGGYFLGKDSTCTHYRESCKKALDDLKHDDEDHYTAITSTGKDGNPTPRPFVPCRWNKDCNDFNDCTIDVCKHHVCHSQIINDYRQRCNIGSLSKKDNCYFGQCQKDGSCLKKYDYYAHGCNSKPTPMPPVVIPSPVPPSPPTPTSPPTPNMPSPQPSPTLPSPQPSPTAAPAVCNDGKIEEPEECDRDQLVIIGEGRHLISAIGEQEICGLDCELNIVHCCYESLTLSVSRNSRENIETMKDLIDLCVSRLNRQGGTVEIEDVRFSFGTNTEPQCEFCGNGIVDEGEECDDGHNNGPLNRCSSLCTVNQLNCCAFGELKIIEHPFKKNPGPKNNYFEICDTLFDEIVILSDIHFTFGSQNLPDCDQFVGGCCLPSDGTCLSRQNTRTCNQKNGMYLGDGSECLDSIVCTKALGACCLKNHCIDNVLVEGCAQKDGMFFVGKKCNTFTCPVPPTPTPTTTTIATFTPVPMPTTEQCGTCPERPGLIVGKEGCQAGRRTECKHGLCLLIGMNEQQQPTVIDCGNHDQCAGKTTETTCDCQACTCRYTDFDGSFLDYEECDEFKPTPSPIPTTTMTIPESTTTTQKTTSKVSTTTTEQMSTTTTPLSTPTFGEQCGTCPPVEGFEAQQEGCQENRQAECKNGLCVMIGNNGQGPNVLDCGNHQQCANTKDTIPCVCQPCTCRYKDVSGQHLTNYEICNDFTTTNILSTTTKISETTTPVPTTKTPDTTTTSGITDTTTGPMLTTTTEPMSTTTTEPMSTTTTEPMSTTTTEPMSTTTTEPMSTTTTEPMSTTTTKPMSTTTTKPMSTTTTEAMLTTTDSMSTTTGSISTTTEPISTTTTGIMTTSTDLMSTTTKPMSTRTTEPMSTRTTEPMSTRTTESMSTTTTESMSTTTTKPKSTTTTGQMSTTTGSISTTSTGSMSTTTGPMSTTSTGTRLTTTTGPISTTTTSPMSTTSTGPISTTTSPMPTTTSEPMTTKTTGPISTTTSGTKLTTTTDSMTTTTGPISTTTTEPISMTTSGTMTTTTGPMPTTTTPMPSSTTGPISTTSTGPISSTTTSTMTTTTGPMSTTTTGPTSTTTSGPMSTTTTGIMMTSTEQMSTTTGSMSTTSTNSMSTTSTGSTLTTTTDSMSTTTEPMSTTTEPMSTTTTEPMSTTTTEPMSTTTTEPMSTTTTEPMSTTTTEPMSTTTTEPMSTTTTEAMLTTTEPMSTTTDFISTTSTGPMSTTTTGSISTTTGPMSTTTTGSISTTTTDSISTTSTGPILTTTSDSMSTTTTKTMSTTTGSISTTTEPMSTTTITIPIPTSSCCLLDCCMEGITLMECESAAGIFNEGIENCSEETCKNCAGTQNAKVVGYVNPNGVAQNTQIIPNGPALTRNLNSLQIIDTCTSNGIEYLYFSNLFDGQYTIWRTNLQNGFTELYVGAGANFPGPIPQLRLAILLGGGFRDFVFDKTNCNMYILLSQSLALLNFADDTVIQLKTTLQDARRIAINSANTMIYYTHNSPNTGISQITIPGYVETQISGATDGTKCIFPSNCGDGSAVSSGTFNEINDLIIDNQNQLYVADRNVFVIRKLDLNPGGLIETYIGTRFMPVFEQLGNIGEGNMKINDVFNLAFDADENLYFNSFDRMFVASNGIVKQIYGGGLNSMLGSSPLDYKSLSISDIAIDTNNNVYHTTILPPRMVKFNYCGQEFLPMTTTQSIMTTTQSIMTTTTQSMSTENPIGGVLETSTCEATLSVSQNSVISSKNLFTINYDVIVTNVGNEDITTATYDITQNNNIGTVVDASVLPGSLSLLDQFTPTLKLQVNVPPIFTAINHMLMITMQYQCSESEIQSVTAITSAETYGTCCFASTAEFDFEGSCIAPGSNGSFEPDEFITFEECTMLP